MKIKKPSLVDLLSIVAVVFFIGSCAQLSQEEEPVSHISNDREVLQVVEELPLFGGCETKACSDKKLLEYVYNEITYPKVAIEEGVEGKTYVTFVVNADGTVSDESVARTDHEVLGEAALAVVSGMNDLEVGWTPARDGGKEVAVEYRLPVTFKLDK